LQDKGIDVSLPQVVDELAELHQGMILLGAELIFRPGLEGVLALKEVLRIELEYFTNILLFEWAKRNWMRRMRRWSKKAQKL
jgi:hypothetical protein